MTDLTTGLNALRRERGFLTIEETFLLSEQGVTVMDPFSTFISGDVRIASGVIIWPNSRIAVGAGGSIDISAGTTLHSGVRIEAEAGSIRIGADCDIGQEGGFTILASAGRDAVVIGNDVRLNGNGSIAINAEIGDGAQVIGAIRVQNCRLGAGGSFREPDPDNRGGVLKGCGVARDLEVPAGMVIQAFGIFAEAPLRSQSFFHPKVAANT